MTKKFVYQPPPDLSPRPNFGDVYQRPADPPKPNFGDVYQPPSPPPIKKITGQWQSMFIPIFVDKQEKPFER